MSYFLVVALVVLLCAAIGAIHRRARSGADRSLARQRRSGVGIGTVRTLADPITVDVEGISGQRFVGRLRPPVDEPTLTALHPGVVLLVTFDPADRERLWLADDITAVRTAFDQMLVCKGLLTIGQLELIRHGTRARGVVTAMTTTGTTREDHREVELDLMVRRPTGGQFPAHETALLPASALRELAPGSTIDAYYRTGDETSVAVCVPPGGPISAHRRPRS